LETRDQACLLPDTLSAKEQQMKILNRKSTPMNRRRFGLRREAQRHAAFRATTLTSQSGVALRLPPQMFSGLQRSFS
jgi:hypothetical protein